MTSFPLAPCFETADEPRGARLGASEVAAVLGLSNFRSPMDVWARKLGLVERSPDSAVTKRGRYLEPGLLDWLGDELGAQETRRGEPFDSPWIVSSSFPHVGCHPDGYLWLDDEQRWIGAELKTARNASEWGDEGDAIPPAYWCQVQVCLALTGLPEWAVGVYLPLHERFRVYRLTLDTRVVPALLRRAAEWWEAHVLAEEPPALDGSKAAREWLLSQHPRHVEPLREATEEEEGLTRALSEIKAQQKALKVEHDRLAVDLQALIGGAEGVTFDGGKATWKAQQRTALNQRRLRDERPDVWAEYSETTTTRVLRVRVKE